MSMPVARLSHQGKGFFLSKWYLDCVATNGETFIGYSARLRWRRFSLRYSSILTFDSVRGARTKTSLLGGKSPTNDGHMIRWEAPALSVRGSWEQLSSPVERTLYKDAAGRVLWSCYQPASNVHIHLEGGRHVSGLGYAERIELTVEPWNLPLDELRWGRFVSSADALAWVGWGGPEPFNLVFHNGVEMPDSVITDSDVTMAHHGMRLTLTEKTTLRHGSLITGALSKIPGIASIVPEQTLNATEAKWRSCGRLERGTGASATGWSIHEVVKFR